MNYAYQQLHKRNQNITEQVLIKKKKLQELSNLEVSEKNISQHRKKFNQLKKQIEKKNILVESLEMEKNVILQQNNQLTNINRKLLQQKQQHENDSKQIEQKITQLQVYVKQYKKDILQLQNELSKERKKNLDHQKQMYKNKIESSRVEQLKEEEKKKIQQIQNLNRLKKSLQEEINNLKNEIETIKFMNRLMIEKEEHLKQQISDLQNSILRINQQNQLVLNDLQENEGKLNINISKLDKQLAYFKEYQWLIQKYKGKKIEGKQIQIIEQLALNKLIKQHWFFKQHYKKMGQESMDQKIQFFEEKKTLHQQINELKKKLVQVNKINSIQAQQLKQTIKDFNQKHNFQIREKEQQLIKLENQIISKEVKNKNKQINQQNFMLEKMQINTQILNKKINQYKQQICKFKNSLKIINKEKQIMIEKIDKYQVENKQLLENLEKMNTQNQKSKEEVFFYINRIKEYENLFQTQHKNTQNQKAELFQKIIKLEKQVIKHYSLNQKLIKEFKIKNQTFKSQFAQMKNKFQILNKEYQDLKQKHIVTYADMEKYQQKNNTLQQQRIEFINQKQNLQIEINKMKQITENGVLFFYQKYKFLQFAKKILENKIKGLKKIFIQNQTALEIAINCFKCEYCMLTLKKAIKIFPCGHLYCQECKDGYRPFCYICKIKDINIMRDELSERTLSLLNVMGLKLDTFEEQLDRL